MDCFPDQHLPEFTAFAPPDDSMGTFYRRLLDHLSDGVYFVDRQLRITYWNQGAEAITGYSAAEVLGRRCSDNVLMHVDNNGKQLCLMGCPLAETLCDNTRREADVYLSHKQGHRVAVNVRVSPITDNDGQVVGAVEVFSDISQRKETERRAMEFESLAYRDPLTGIPNRRFAEMKVHHAIQEVERFQRNVALLLIDLDGFKEVNDRYGHVAGDALLRSVSRTLVRNTRSGSTIARWGGDEFIVLVEDVPSGDLALVVSRTRTLIAASGLEAGGHRISTTASVGSTMILSTDTPECVLERADKLMYRTKGILHDR